MFKKISLLFVTAVFGLLLVGGVSPIHSAQQEIREEQKDRYLFQEIADDLYIAVDTKAVIEGDVNGDLFVGGGEVEVIGNVSGDLFAAGGIITVAGDVEKSVFLAGGQVTIDGKVGRDAFIAGGTIEINGEVEEDVNVAGGRININSKIGDDLRVSGGTVEIEEYIDGDLLLATGYGTLLGDVGNDLIVAGGNIYINSAKVGGDLVTYEVKDLYVDENIEIGGERREEMVEDRETVADLSILTALATFWGKLLWNMIQSVGFILLGILIWKIAPVKSNSTLWMMTSPAQNFKSMGVGCLALPVGFIIMAILAISIIGWQILGFVIALTMIAKLLATVYVGTKVGKWLVGLVSTNNGMIVSLIVGVIVIQLLRSIPVIGGLVGFIVLIWGVGAMIRMQYKKYSVAKKSA